MNYAHRFNRWYDDLPTMRRVVVFALLAYPPVLTVVYADAQWLRISCLAAMLALMIVRLIGRGGQPTKDET